jgi:hypothetical protein
MNASPLVHQPMVPHAGPMAKQSMKYDDNPFGVPILASKLEICLSAKRPRERRPPPLSVRRRS